MVRLYLAFQENSSKPEIKNKRTFRYARLKAIIPDFFRIDGYFAHVAWITFDHGI